MYLYRPSRAVTREKEKEKNMWVLPGYRDKTWYAFEERERGIERGNMAEGEKEKYDSAQKE